MQTNTTTTATGTVTESWPTWILLAVRRAGCNRRRHRARRLFQQSLQPLPSLSSSLTQQQRQQARWFVSWEWYRVSLLRLRCRRRSCRTAPHARNDTEATQVDVAVSSVTTTASALLGRGWFGVVAPEVSSTTQPQLQSPPPLQQQQQSLLPPRRSEQSLLGSSITDLIRRSRQPPPPLSPSQQQQQQQQQSLLPLSALVTTAAADRVPMSPGRVHLHMRQSVDSQTLAPLLSPRSIEAELRDEADDEVVGDADGALLLPGSPQRREYIRSDATTTITAAAAAPVSFAAAAPLSEGRDVRAALLPLPSLTHRRAAATAAATSAISPPPLPSATATAVAAEATAEAAAAAGSPLFWPGQSSAALPPASPLSLTERLRQHLRPLRQAKKEKETKQAPPEQ